MTNPCDICIVVAMCRNLCDKLCKYLNLYLLHFPDHSKEYTTRAIAKALRMGMIELTIDTERGWRYIGKYKNYEERINLSNQRIQL